MDFYERVIKYLRSEFPEKTLVLDDLDLKSSIEEGIARARLYKIESEADVVRFIDLQWRMDENFDINPQYPWAREILSNLRVSSEDKIEMLRDAYAMHKAVLVGEAS